MRGSGSSVVRLICNTDVGVNNNKDLETIFAWSLHCSSSAIIQDVVSTEETRQQVVIGSGIPRGRGQSFGDASLPDGGVALAVSPNFELARFSLNTESGLLTCPAGMSLSQVLERIVPAGWVLPVVPGSSGITIGGVVAADGHGKNHYTNGSIADHVSSLEIMVASGEVLSASRIILPDIFWATIGGLGLTGIILEVTLQLKTLISTQVIQEVTPFGNLREMLEIIEAKKSSNEFLLGTVDGGFGRRHKWRGVITTGTIAVVQGVGGSNHYPLRKVLNVPRLAKYAHLSNLATWGLNKSIRFATRYLRKGETDLNRFFFPQDSLANWNRLFGLSGFVDYQFCIPINQCLSFVSELHIYLNKNSIKCFLVAVKRFRMTCSKNPLTFAQDGISIALDIPLRRDTLRQLSELDDIVISYGGRVNLIKDARLSRSSFSRMYPRKDEWLEIKHKYDPDGRFRSKLSSRLGLNSA